MQALFGVCVALPNMHLKAELSQQIEVALPSMHLKAELSQQIEVALDSGAHFNTQGTCGTASAPERVWWPCCCEGTLLGMCTCRQDLVCGPHRQWWQPPAGPRHASAPCSGHCRAQSASAYAAGSSPVQPVHPLQQAPPKLS